MTALGRRSFLAGSLALAGASALRGSRPARAAAADLDFASALDAAWAIRAGQVSSVELTSRMLERIAWQAYFRTHDVFLMPTALVPAFPHDQSGNQLTRVLTTPGGPRPYSDLCFWISFATLAGLPATTAPVGITAGSLPVGLQIVGPYLEDATPIAVAGRLADVIGGFRAPPGF